MPKDVIISGESNIYPREVEEVLLKHAARSQVSVIGRSPGPPSGKMVAVTLVFVDASARELRPPFP